MSDDLSVVAVFFLFVCTLSACHVHLYDFDFVRRPVGRFFSLYLLGNMYYLVFITLITLLTLSLPWLSPKIANHYGKTLHTAPVWLPVVAAFCWAIAGFLPDVHISSQTNTFQEHFVGGGMYSAILFIYFSKLLGWRRNWILSLLGLFAWTSALGVLNELVEFTITKLNITHIDITDTSWDLMANTVGSLLVYIIWQIARLIGRRTNASYNKR